MSSKPRSSKPQVRAGGRKGRAIALPIVALGFALLAWPAAASRAAELVTTDYLLNHRSTDPFYAEHQMDPTVLIHVREVVLAGNERTAPDRGRVLVFAHGATTPGYVAFDAPCERCSMMRHFALAGWDTFTLDYEGYGRSTRQPSMDAPELFPEDGAPTHTAVDVADLARAVAFVRDLRGVDKVQLLGWSLGASRTAPIYAIENPDKVARLVLFAGGFRDLGSFEPSRADADAMEARKVLLARPAMEGWERFGGKPETFLPGAFEAYRDAFLASDPRSQQNGGQVRFPAGRVADLFRSNPQFDAAKLTVPTLVIRGSHDTFGSTPDSRRLVEELGSRKKAFVEIPGGSHFLPFEVYNAEFFKAIQDFLEAE